MFQKMITYTAPFLLGAVMLFVNPTFAQAQHHGGGGHGGFHAGHMGGFHAGHLGGYGGYHVGHLGGYHAGYLGGYSGGYRHGLGGYYYPSYGYRSYGYYPFGYGYGSSPYGYGSGYSPYYYSPYSYYGYPYSYGGSPYYGGYSSYNLGSYLPLSSGMTTQPATYASSTVPVSAQNTSVGRITLNVPANAEVWFDGTKTTSTGSIRVYTSPSLNPGQSYSYDIRARWEENGKPVEQTQHVSFSPGNHISLTFPKQSS